jgi:hypothetical protein
VTLMQDQFRHWVIDWSGDELAHRLDPDDPARAMCGHDWADIFWEDDWAPDNYVSCTKCNQLVGEARRLSRATAAPRSVPMIFSPEPVGTRKGRRRARLRRIAVTSQMNDYFRGGAFSEDPDAPSKQVWIFKTGASFHRRDCHVVESRDGAFRVPVADAQKRKLTRCMHCAPSVR